MAPHLSEDEIDDLIYVARAGEDADLTEMLQQLASRESASPAEILEAAREDQGKATCLHMAAANGHAKTVTLILSHLPPKAPGMTPTSTAAPESQSETATATATATYIDMQNAFGNTALHWACLGGHLDIVKLLLSRGASPALANDKDQIPLDLAAFNNHMHVVEHFLSQSKDLEGDNAQDGGLEQGARDLKISDATGNETNDTAEAAN
ncbi:ankyrin [Xylariomycetidae sp. FL0641]|nr:ankyrin [Xylariomycetidae sp. FL0641]